MKSKAGLFVFGAVMSLMATASAKTNAVVCSTPQTSKPVGYYDEYECEQAQSEVSDLESKISELEYLAEELRSQVDSMKSAIDDIESALGSAISELDRFEYEDWGDVLPDLIDALSRANSAVSDAGDEASSLEAAMSELEYEF